MQLELEGKTIVVTGGSDGLGRALCQRLVAEGAKVAFCGRDSKRVNATSELLQRVTGDVMGIEADVTNIDDLSRLVRGTLERWGRIDGLVNNAGRIGAKAFLEITDDEFLADLDLKLLAAARLCRLTLEPLAEQHGAIVNVLALAAKTPGPFSMPSSVSRAAGMAFTKALSKEVGPLGVRANAVLVGHMQSSQWERIAASKGEAIDDFYQSLAVGAGIPLGRVGSAMEFADVVAFLLSPRAGFVSGTAINLDGGLCAMV